MKFARYLKDLEQDAPTQWRGKFLNYKQLKKAIKKKHASEVAAAMARHEPRSADDWFFEVLNAELKLIDRQFESAARQLIKYFDKGQSLLLKPLLCCLPLASVALRAHPEELAEQAHWCQEYAKVNAMGLRKIVKKHDKVYGNKEGQKFLQACWMNGNHGRATFLHSPLLTELRALEVMLEPLAAQPATVPQSSEARQTTLTVEEEAQPGASCAASEQAVAAGLAHAAPATPAGEACVSTAGASSTELVLPRALPGCLTCKVTGECESSRSSAACSASGMPPSPASLAEDTFRCSICLDLLYKPLGLTCGHVFCTPCALGAAGMRNALGTTHAILQHIKPRAACPECRRTGVYLEAVQLKRAGQLIQKRWPEDFAKREEEENARLADMRRKLQEQRAAANDGSWGFVLPY